MIDAGSTRLASLALFFGAAVWGLYWMPLRALSEMGLSGGWSVAYFNFCPLLVLVPFLIWKRHTMFYQLRAALFIGAATGLGLALYSTSIVLGSVARRASCHYDRLSVRFRGCRGGGAAIPGSVGFRAVSRTVHHSLPPRLPVPPKGEWQAVGYGSGGATYAHQMAERARQSLVRIALKDIADAMGDVDAFIAQYDPATRKVPKIAAEIAARLLVAGRQKMHCVSSSGRSSGIRPGCQRNGSRCDWTCWRRLAGPPRWPCGR